MKFKKINQFILTTLVISTLVSSATPIQSKALTQIPTTKSVQNSSITSSNTSTKSYYESQALNPNWGLGTKQTEYVSNNRSYNWYIDQGNTGEYSNSNCGPSSVTMALKWINGNFNKTAEDARNIYPKDGAWWYTNDITNYLTKYNGKYSVQALSEASLKSELKQGDIAILCINTSYISFNPNSEQRTGRFYSYEGGHFLVVKGYRIVDNKTFFEVYDPNNWSQHYQDGQEKGKDRYYLSSDLIKAASTWWNQSIIVEPNSNNSTANTNSTDSATSTKSKDTTPTTSDDSTTSTNSKGNNSTDSSNSQNSTNSNNSKSSNGWNWLNWFRWFN